tara:strand:- start:289 stop:468 length:180 start_codon:yes stop_codon:yes gene_type:complete
LLFLIKGKTSENKGRAAYDLGKKTDWMVAFFLGLAKHEQQPNKQMLGAAQARNKNSIMH